MFGEKFQVLSYHSDYFNTLFNGDFKEQTTHEIQMEFDEMDEFAILLSLLHDNPIFPTGIFLVIAVSLKIFMFQNATPRNFWNLLIDSFFFHLSNILLNYSSFPLQSIILWSFESLTSTIWRSSWQNKWNIISIISTFVMGWLLFRFMKICPMTRKVNFLITCWNMLENK